MTLERYGLISKLLSRLRYVQPSKMKIVLLLVTDFSRDFLFSPPFTDYFTLSAPRFEPALPHFPLNWYPLFLLPF